MGHAGLGLNYPCEKCGSGTGVTDSRRNPHGIRRRRKCYSCGHKVTTVEIPMDHFRTLDVETPRNAFVADFNVLISSFNNLNRVLKAHAKLGAQE
jgi:transcriptional regulator NrdR family protein